MPKRNLANAPDYSQSLFNFELELAVKAAPVRKRRKKPSVKVVSIKTDCGFVPSAFQSAIFDAVRSGTKSVVISSVPGSGKTTTVKELVPELPADASILMLAFNRHARDQIQKKINELKKRKGKEGVTIAAPQCRTIHSIGNEALCNAYRVIRKGATYKGKYRQLCKSYLASCNIYDRDIWKVSCAL